MLPHTDSASVATLSTSAESVSLHSHPVNTTTTGENTATKMIMSYVVAEPREIKKFTLNSTKYTNMAEIKSTTESPRIRMARAKTAVQTKSVTRLQKTNSKSRKKRRWSEHETEIEFPRSRRIRVTKKFPTEFESVLKRIFPDDFVTIVPNKNNYYRSGDKIQKSPGKIIRDC